MKNKVAYIIICLCLAVSPTNIFGAEQVKNTKTNTIQTEKKPNLTIKDAVETGVKNSIALLKVENQTKISKLTEDNANDNKTDINMAKFDLYSAGNDLSNGASSIYSSMSQLDSAQTTLNNGIAPQDIPIRNPSTGEVIATIPKGTNISDFLNGIGQGNFTQTVINSVQSTLDGQRILLNQGLDKLDSSTRTYYSEKSKFDTSMTVAMSSVSNKLGLSTISSLDADALGELIYVMAKESNKVTTYSTEIYKKQIALLIQKCYYEALKEQKLVEVKSGIMEMAKLQYDFAQASLDVGAKAKDDMLLAKTYYNSTIIAYNLEVNNLNKALLDLKKNMCVPLDTNYILADVTASKTQNYDLAQGIENGLTTRLEIKVTAAQKAIYNQLLIAVEDSDYKTYDNQYKEATLLLEKVILDERNTKLEIETSIRQSYDTMLALEKSLENTEEMVVNAKECLEIAKYKYDAGFGADNAALAKLNLQSLSGTIMEVIAAQQTLASIEEQVIELTNNYNLATEKYLTDIGIMPY